MFKIVPVSPVSKINKFRLCSTTCTSLESAVRESAYYVINFGVTCKIVSYE